MSDPLEQDFDDDFRPRRTRRARLLLFVVVGVVLGFFLITLFASLYTDRLWYSSVGYTGVFDTMMWTRVGLFVGFGLVMGGTIAASMVIAYRSRPVQRPDSPEQTGLDRYRDAVAPIRGLLVVGVAGVIGLFGGVAANGEWRSFLLWTHRQSFHTQDAFFGKDVGFYVFTLPWLHFLVGFVIAVLVLAALAAVVVHYLYGGIRLQATSDRLSTAATIQLSVLVGLALVAKAFGYYLDRFDLVTGSGQVVTGMGYTDQHAVLPARNILIGVALICAVLFFLTAWRRNWLLPGVGISLLVVTSILLGLLWPAFVEEFQVAPNRSDKEAPYIEANIQATRTAYDLQGIQQVTSDAPQATAASVQDLMDQTSAVPVVDPKLIAGAFEANQLGASYYRVPDVLDVDHYRIEGQDRALVLSARGLNQDGIPAADQNWSNLHTVYTHGSGIIAAYGNQRPADNVAQSAQVQWAQGLNPDENTLEQSIGSFQPRIYFGEDMNTYSIVGKSPGGTSVELDQPADGSQGPKTTYAGPAGVGVGGFFHKLMYAIKFGDTNFLLSSRVGPDSKVLDVRDPVQRVEKVAPWLTPDNDVYPAVVDGHILWIVDGYTTTAQYPQSQRNSLKDMTTDSLTETGGLQTLPTDQINYIRNSVKATVDAYTGKVTLYAWDESDPILKAWRAAFPGTVLDRSQVPTDLLPHLRYPEDLFKVQRYQYAKYHVTDPADFFAATNLWVVPTDPTLNGSGPTQPPVRMFSRRPDDGTQMWSLTSNYVPRKRSTLVGVLAADSDATSSDYGTLRVEEPVDKGTLGPGQVFTNLTTDPRISRKTQSFRLGDAAPKYGNVVSVPLSSGVMYVVPVYATSTTGASTTDASTSPYLILRYVMVAYGDRYGIGNTLVKAIADMAGTSPSSTGTSGGNGNPSGNGNQGGTGNSGGNQGGTHSQKSNSERARALLAKAQRDFAAAQKALNEGRAADWVRLNHRARAEVARALNLLS